MDILFLELERVDWKFFAVFWPVWMLTKGPVSVSLDSELIQEWQHRLDLKPKAAKAVAGVAAHENVMGVVDSQTARGKRLWEDKYVRISKALRSYGKTQRN